MVKVLSKQLKSCKTFDWNYDGSSTGQAEGLYSELLLKPVAVYNNPFMGGANHVLVLCETLDKDGNPQFQIAGQKQITYFPKIKKKNLVWNRTGIFYIRKRLSNNRNEKQGRYYCSVGTQNTYYRKVAERHISL